MNLKERIKVVRAMETIVRQLNDEDLIIPWIVNGVADEDITEFTPDEDIEYYAEDETFRQLMDLFLLLMKDATESGGLYCDGIVTKAGK